MHQTLIWTVIAIGLTAVLSLVVVGLSSGLIESWRTEPTPKLESSSINLPAAEEPYAYLMKLENGRLNIYLRGEETPEYVLMIVENNLPEYDRGQLEQGVRIKDTDELAARIEDYLS